MSPLSDIDKAAFAEALAGLQIGARRGMEKAGEISFAKWRMEQKTDLQGDRVQRAGIDRTELNKRRKIMSLLGELNVEQKEITRIEKLYPDLYQKAITPITEKEARKDPLQYKKQAKSLIEYRRIKTKRKRVEKILEQIRRINSGLPIEQQIDIETILGTPQVQEFATIEEATAANLPIGTEITIQGRQAVIE